MSDKIACRRHRWIDEFELIEVGKGECEPAPTGRFVCEQCGETSSACNTCGRAVGSSLLICDRCLEREREVLVHIQEAWRLIGSANVEILQLGTVDHDARTRAATSKYPDQVSVPVGAGNRYDLDARDDFELYQGIMRANPNRTLLQLVRDPENVMDTLHEIAEDWASRREVKAEGNVLTWLGESMLWAAQTLDLEDWDDYRATARKVRGKLQGIAGVLPQRDPIPCQECGEPDSVVQDWIDKHGRPYKNGLSDKLRCIKCGFVWDDRAHFDFLNLATVRAAPLNHPDTLVSLVEARASLPTARRNTINKALSRDRHRSLAQRRIPERGKNAYGEPLYRLGDIATALGMTVPASTMVEGSSA